MPFLENNAKRIYSGLIIFLLLLVPLCNVITIRFGFPFLFHDEAELILYMFYATPLWLVFISLIGVELYRQAVMKISPGFNLVLIMSIGGLAFSGLTVLLCPIGPEFFSTATVKLALTGTVICGVLSLGIVYFFRLRQLERD